MLYLFGQLALNDALFYHEDFQSEAYFENQVRCRGLAQPAAAERAASASRRLRRSSHLALPARMAARRA